MNISNVHNCFGCGVCSVSCRKDIISIRLNTKGFYEPYISNIDKCIQCGLCVKNCAFLKEELALKDKCIDTFVAWSKDFYMRKKCSSGGAAFEIAKKIINDGGYVCAVKFDENKNLALHYVSRSLDDLFFSIGSKYIQSYTKDGFLEIIKLAKEHKKNGITKKILVTGAPCQIDSFRWLVRSLKLEDNFVLLDFFCHGVPSKIMWDKYVDYNYKHIGKIKKVSWRNKFTGWHDSWAMYLKGEYGEIKSWLSKGDIFYKLFLSDACLGKQCYDNCKYKNIQSSADIRIGDAWDDTFNTDDYGINSVITFTKNGKEALMNSDCEIKEYPLEIVVGKQMLVNPSKTRLNRWVMKELENTSSSILTLSNLVDKFRKQECWKRRFMNPIQTIINFFKLVKRRYK